MIFQHTAQWVLDKSPHTGRAKTQTRRPAKSGDHIVTASPHDNTIVAVERNGRLLYEVGRTYAVQPGRGKRSLGRIRLRGIRREERAGNIAQGDARAEGFATPDDFRSVWANLYNRDGLERPCYALQIEKVNP